MTLETSEGNQWSPYLWIEYFINAISGSKTFLFTLDFKNISFKAGAMNMQHYVWKILGLLLGNAEILKSGYYICLIWHSVLMFVLTKRQLIYSQKE